MKMILNITNENLFIKEPAHDIFVPWPEGPRDLKKANEDIDAVLRMVRALPTNVDKVYIVAKRSYWMNTVAGYCEINKIATFLTPSEDGLVRYFK